ncbi:hypothetical protein HAX54_025866 [Datura stramonium]|uniref:Uncharacterized protein n=1 Tax=Datura stramonium TaxID=4076 RepID=A0ABS8V075_DATST|nr:hypothetical protein [Datura stramonium]
MWPETGKECPFESKGLMLAGSDLGHYFPNLQKLYLNCQFIGSIPSSLANASELLQLDFPVNNFTGNIPKGFAVYKCSILETTNFVGTLPYSTVAFTVRYNVYSSSETELVEAYPERSQTWLEGNIPSTLRNCNQLLRLDISENNLTGTIPQQLIALSSLTKIYAYYNSLTGPLPVYIGNWSHLTYLDFSYNNFSGMIPRSLGKCLSLGEIYMKETPPGTIPDLEDLQDLQSLDLSLNNLSGPIPRFIANLTSLLYLNLSFNNLEVRVPKNAGIFFKFEFRCIYRELQALWWDSKAAFTTLFYQKLKDTEEACTRPQVYFDNCFCCFIFNPGLVSKFTFASEKRNLKDPAGTRR